MDEELRWVGEWGAVWVGELVVVWMEELGDCGWGSWGDCVDGELGDSVDGELVGTVRMGELGGHVRGGAGSPTMDEELRRPRVGGGAEVAQSGWGNWGTVWVGYLVGAPLWMRS